MKSSKYSTNIIIPKHMRSVEQDNLPQKGKHYTCEKCGYHYFRRPGGRGCPKCRGMR